MKRAVKLAWELVADPPILQFFNWEGRLRTDRPIKKTGIRKLQITTAILGNIFFTGIWHLNKHI